MSNKVEQCNNMDVYVYKLEQAKQQNNTKSVEHYQKMIDNHTCFICRNNDNYEYIGNKRVKLKGKYIFYSDVFKRCGHESTFIRYKTGFDYYEYEKCEVL